MSTPGFSNLNEFYNKINPFLEKSYNWDNKDIPTIDSLINTNLRLILENTETDHARELQAQLKKLSDSIKLETPEAHNLAFKISTIAQGLYSVEKTDFTKIFPPEISNLLIKDFNLSELKNVRVSKVLDTAGDKPLFEIMNNPNFDLQAHFKTKDEAINYLITHKDQVFSANFSRFSNLTDADVKKLIDNCTKLKHLSLNCVNLTDEGFENLNGLKQLTSLKISGTPNLQGGGSNLTDKVLEKLKGLNNLTSIAFNLAMFTDDGMKNLKGLPLQDIKFSSCNDLTDNCLENFKDSKLTSVEFSYCDNIKDEGLKHLAKLPLNSINFTYCEELTDRCADHFKDSPLTSINFSRTHLTSVGIENLIKGKKLLESIDFSACHNLTDESLKHLAESPALSMIKLTTCQKLTDEGLKHLAGLSLRSIDFTNCKGLTDGCVKNFEKMPIEFFSFRSCDQITDESLIKLIETFDPGGSNKLNAKIYRKEG